MFVTFTEIYEDVTHYNNAIGKKFWLSREVTINTDHICYMKEDRQVQEFIRTDKDSYRSLKENQMFTRLSLTRGMSGQELIVFGSLGEVTEILKDASHDKRRTLKG